MMSFQQTSSWPLVDPASSLCRRRELESQLFSLLAAVPSLPLLKAAHALLYRLGLHQSGFLAAKLLRRLADLGAPAGHYPLRLFSQLPHPSSFLWTALLRVSAALGPPCPQPLHLYSLMRRAFPPPPPLSFTFSALLKFCALSKSVEMGSQVHAQAVVVGGFDCDLFVQNTLVDLYVQCAQLGCARKIFDEMPLRNLITWTTMIVGYARNGDMCKAEELFGCSPEKDMVAWTAMVSGYAQNARPQEALEMFERMQRVGVGIDEVSLLGAVSACAQLGVTGYARRVREIASKNGFRRGVVVGSAMVDMYAKCGLIDEAWKMFDGMEERNVYTYSSMIVGLAMHGKASKAIELFREMVTQTDVKPNKVTFIGVLMACSHAGMVEEGRRFFASMSNDYEIAPTADHYGCMVDLLGRGGHVEEALELATKMQVEPNAGVWGALLGACRIHKKPHIAKIAADHLLRLEPDSIGNYVLLCNIYAAAGMWDKVLEVRKLMRGRGLRKNPGSSWMEDRDGVMHEFFAGDCSHPMLAKIMETLGDLLQRLDVTGYVPILNSVIYDVSNDEKERLLRVHSEKLALAFGLITINAGGTIRIVKNLRICEDCHLVMCLASAVEKREIVVRDNMRFHHFKGGVCSCGGFW